MSRIAFATCTPLPEPDVDESLLMEACKRAGLDVHLAAWNDPAVNWGTFDTVILRSTWNYYEDEAAFRSWVQQVSQICRLWNSGELVLDNIDKGYLGVMAKAGVPVVPTRFVHDEPLEHLLDKARWDNFVLKPTVSAGSFMTSLFSRSDLPEAERFRTELEKTHRVMIQEFMPSVFTEGETSLIYIGGELTHSVIKAPRFYDGEESVSEATTPTKEQIQTATQALNTLKHAWLYARVDLMVNPEGQWLLSELELIEPSLFFKQYPPALDKFLIKIHELALG